MQKFWQGRSLIWWMRVVLYYIPFQNFWNPFGSWGCKCQIRAYSLLLYEIIKMILSQRFDWRGWVRKVLCWIFCYQLLKSKLFVAIGGVHSPQWRFQNQCTFEIAESITKRNVTFIREAAELRTSTEKCFSSSLETTTGKDRLEMRRHNWKDSDELFCALKADHKI